MPKFCVLIITLLSGFSLFAQFEVSGVVNNYAKVLGVLGDTCQSQLELDNADALEIGDLVLLIQMRGAGINISNTSQFGDIVAMNNAGFYELNEVEAINGNNVLLKYQLSNQYIPFFKVQLVKIPVYQDAEIVDVLTAAPWNGDTGGICAIKVEGQLFMEGIIDVSGLGFRGGDATITAENDCSWFNPQNDYYYDENSWRGAEKGEGISAVVNPENANGKGAIANGGGGGNDHNSGGGGGANITSGGKGGDNDEPSTFGCRGNHPGVGGKPIVENSNRLFLGGGGGAGHENNGNGTDGGAGGGIVILIVNEFYPLGASIYAEGETPPDGVGDGAGGGGAGGTILLEVQSIATTVHLEVRGGDGGLVDNALAERCHGPGGGGSGGRIITNLMPGDPFETILNGGQAGMSINSASCPDDTNGAQDGESGVVEVLNEIIVSTDTFHLPNADFDYVINGFDVEFINLSDYIGMSTWDFGDMVTSNASDPNHTYSSNGTYEVSLIIENDCGSDTVWQEVVVDVQIAPEAAFIADQQSGCVPLTVQFSDASTGNIDNYNWTFEGGTPMNSNLQNPEITYNVPGIFDVQLIINGSGGADTLLLEETIEVFDLPTADFGFTSNDLSVDFSNLSQDADNVSWDFGDMITSTELNPNHIYSMSGTYDVQLIATNQCGSDTIIQTITVEASNPLQAAFSYDDGNGCAPWLVQFEDMSTGNFDSWFWTFDGGTPANSTQENPQVLYVTPGLYDVQLEISGSQGTNLILLEDLIEIAPSVDTDFDFSINEAEVSFINNSTNATEYQWDFGDGSPFSNEVNPVHEYPTPGTYEVTLVATSEFCGKAVTKTIFLEYTNTVDLELAGFKLFPNPVEENLMIETGLSGINYLKIYNLDGKVFPVENESFIEKLA